MGRLHADAQHIELSKAIGSRVFPVALSASGPLHLDNGSAVANPSNPFPPALHFDLHLDRRDAVFERCVIRQISRRGHIFPTGERWNDFTNERRFANDAANPPQREIACAVEGFENDLCFCIHPTFEGVNGDRRPQFVENLAALFFAALSEERANLFNHGRVGRPPGSGW